MSNIEYITVEREDEACFLYVEGKIQKEIKEGEKELRLLDLIMQEFSVYGVRGFKADIEQAISEFDPSECVQYLFIETELPDIFQRRLEMFLNYQFFSRVENDKGSD